QRFLVFGEYQPALHGARFVAWKRLDSWRFHNLSWNTVESVGQPNARVKPRRRPDQVARLTFLDGLAAFGRADRCFGSEADGGLRASEGLSCLCGWWLMIWDDSKMLAGNLRFPRFHNARHN